MPPICLDTTCKLLGYDVSLISRLLDRYKLLQDVPIVSVSWSIYWMHHNFWISDHFFDFSIFNLNCWIFLFFIFPTFSKKIHMTLDWWPNWNSTIAQHQVSWISSIGNSTICNWSHNCRPPTFEKQIVFSPHALALFYRTIQKIMAFIFETCVAHMIESMARHHAILRKPERL